MKVRTLLRNGLAVLPLMMILAQHAAAQEQTTPQDGGTVIIALPTDATTLNPSLSTEGTVVTVGALFYEGLVKVDGDGNIVPVLAESWDISDDGLVYTFKLRDALFHDGTPMTSADVLYSLTEVSAKYSSVFSSQGGQYISTIETPDDKTVVITLSEPFGPFMRSLSCAIGACILPAHLLEGTDIPTNALSTEAPVGTGPFRFQEWVRGDNIRAVRNENYWNPGLPHLDTVITRFMINPTARTQALLTGEVDILSSYSFALSDGPLLANDPRYTLWPAPPNAGTYAMFNVEDEILDDVAVRQALVVATDRQYILDAAYYGLATLGTAPWPVDIAWATDPAINYEESHAYDPVRAAAILDEAGYPVGADGYRFTLTVSYDSNNAERGQLALALQSMWRQIGVNLEITPAETAILIPRVYAEGNFDVYLATLSTFGDPALGIARLFITDRIGANYGNASRYSNPEIDQLFELAGSLTTFEERGAVYRQAQAIVLRDMPSFVVVEAPGFDAAISTLHGLWEEDGRLSWDTAWLEQ